MGKYCTNCGKELTKGAEFCQNCGAKVETPPGQVIPQEPIQQQQEQIMVQQTIAVEPQKKSKKKIFGIVGVIIIVAVVIIAALYLFVLQENDSTSTNAETDIIGAWRMTYHSQLGDDPDALDKNWIFNSDGTIEFEPPVSDGFEEYYISGDEICFTGFYYPDPRCYEYNFGASKNSLTLKNDVVTITFERIV